MKYLISLVLALSLVSGCVTKQQYDEVDVVGIEATSPNILNIGTAVKVDVGIVHGRHFSNPTSTNKMYSAPWKYSVNATINPLSQTVSNSIDTNSR